MQLLSNLRRHHNQRSQALIALTSASILWRITTPVLKWSLGESSPVFLFAFYRFLIAGIIFFILARPAVKIQKKHIPVLVASLFVGTSIHIILAFYGIRLSTAMNASFISTASPFLTLLAGFIILREKLKSNLIIGGILGFFGMLFLIFGPMSSGDLSNAQVLGNALLILSILCWIGYEVVGKKYLFPHYSVRTITFYANENIFFLQSHIQCSALPLQPTNTYTTPHETSSSHILSTIATLHTPTTPANVEISVRWPATDTNVYDEVV